MGWDGILTPLLRELLKNPFIVAQCPRGSHFAAWRNHSRTDGRSQGEGHMSEGRWEMEEGGGNRRRGSGSEDQARNVEWRRASGEASHARSVQKENAGAVPAGAWY